MAEESAKHDDPVICEGDVLCGRYRADRVIEHGGTGTVLAVTDLMRDEPAAIKMISADHGEGQLLLARLRREADILSRLTSPHVVRVLDVAMHGRTLCLVMELLEGSNMARFVRKRGPLPIAEAVGYVIQACDGLADAHQAGVVHRDVKPQNVFLAARSDGTSIVKVLDFGVSKQYSVTTGQGLTVGGALLGSPPYSAPEQLRDPTGVDRRADIWSVGLVLYFLLTRHNAFDAETFPALLIKIATQQPPPLRELRPDVPEELETIILKCIEKEREDRYPDMAALARVLTPFAPAWSEAFVPAIDIRASGRGSLASLPIIPLRPDIPEEPTPVSILPVPGMEITSKRPASSDPSEAAGKAPRADAKQPSTAADHPPASNKAARSAPAEAKQPASSEAKPPASTRTKQPASSDAKPPVSSRGKQPVSGGGKQAASPAVKKASAAALKNATTATMKKASVRGLMRATSGEPSAARPPAGGGDVQRGGGALKVLVIVLVALLAPVLVGLALFLVVQFGGCGAR
jgi:serine/threonine protein kinase